MGGSGWGRGRVGGGGREWVEVWESGGGGRWWGGGGGGGEW